MNEPKKNEDKLKNGENGLHPADEVSASGDVIIDQSAFTNDETDLPGVPKKRGFFKSLFFYAFYLMTITIIFSGILASASYFTVWYFIRGEEIKIPNLVGLEMNQVLTTLQPFGISVKLDKYEYSEIVPAGKVITQYPYPGTNAKKGSPVKLTISKGSPLIKVPNLVGDLYTNAEVKIRAAGLTVGNHSFIMGDQVNKDKVISQDPLPQSGVPKDFSINLLINTGAEAKKIVMPDLSSFTINEATEILLKNGIKSINSERRKSAEKSSGMVIEQNPKAGTLITPETTIQLIISAGG